MKSIPTRFRDRARHVRRVASSAAAFGLRRLVRDKVGDAEVFGEALVSELDQLKGMAMKVGQILSYMDGALPPETQAALAKLQRGQEPLPFEALRPSLEAGLGASAEALFDRIDPTAVAAASIGQVHRGAVRGEEVAIKIQYPGVHETMDADVIQLRRIARVAGLATRVDGQAIVDDLRDRLHEECDYAHEAAWQARFAGWFRDDPAVVVPAVVSDRSSGTVLTTHWCDGRPLEDFLSAPKEARDAAGLVLARFAWRSMFVHGAIHADPHPGNQLYRDDGTVVFLDFGCIRVFEPAWLDAVRAEIRALLMGDRRAFRDAVVAQGMAPRPDRFDFDGHWAMQRHMWSPYLEPGYTFGPAWVEEGMRFSGPNAPNAFELAVPPPWIWMIRLQWGLHAVLARLGATGPFDAVLRDALGDG